MVHQRHRGKRHIVVAKTAPKIVKGKEKQQITAFIVEMDTPGVSITQSL